MNASAIRTTVPNIPATTTIAPFSDSLTPGLKRRLPFRPASVVVLDCDLYSSTQEALAWMADLLAPDAVLLFDDWHSFGGSPDRGQPLAFREFLDQHPEIRAEEGWEFADNGKTFLLSTAGGRAAG